jgi:hypothetical protein
MSLRESLSLNRISRLGAAILDCMADNGNDQHQDRDRQQHQRRRQHDAAPIGPRLAPLSFAWTGGTRLLRPLLFYVRCRRLILFHFL